MKTYRVPMRVSVDIEVLVQADSPLEAMNKAEKGEWSTGADLDGNEWQEWRVLSLPVLSR